MRKTNPPPAVAAAGAESRQPRESRELSLRQHAAARWLVQGFPLGQVARHLGVSRHTLTRWRADARFRAQLERLRAEATAAVTAPFRRPAPASGAARLAQPAATG